jgi:hypothetical protein
MQSDKQQSGPPEKQPTLDELRVELERWEVKLHVAKIAYLHRTTLDGRQVSYETLSSIAKEYIKTSYAKTSVAKLLR